MKHTAIRTGAALVLLGLLVVVPRSLFAADWVNFNSAGTPPTPFQLKRAKAKGIELKPEPGAPLRGLLFRPKGEGPFPAVVLLHGCRGIQPYQRDWAGKLAEWGYVALLVDSFGPRNVQEICREGYQGEGFSEAAADRVFDAYGALAYAAGLTFVDPSRVAAMGWSGLRFLGTITTAGVHVFFDHKFKAAVSLYPDCHEPSSGEFYAPLLVLTGELDDWTPARGCEKLAAVTRAQGGTLELVVYPRTHHSFDDPDVGESQYLPEVYNINKNPARGATLGFNRTAYEDSLTQVREFLAKYLN
jgi:dienelactone hydrolase